MKQKQNTGKKAIKFKNEIKRRNKQTSKTHRKEIHLETQGTCIKIIIIVQWFELI